MRYGKIMKQLKSFNFTDAQRKKLASIILKLDKEKQDILVSGDNIATINGQSLLNGGNISLIKTGIFSIVTELPTNDIDKDKVYLVSSTETDNENKFSEYIYTDNGWEKLGTFTAEIDLSNYVQKTDVVTSTTNGLMLASDKVKLDAFEETVNSIPEYIVGGDESLSPYDIFRVRNSLDLIEVTYLYKKISRNSLYSESFRIYSATQSSAGLMSYLDKQKLDSLVKYKAGNGIDITKGTISCTLDTSLYSIVTELPETGLPNKIYLLPSTETEEGNIYTEHCYVDNKWEELGKYKADINLEPYKRALNLPSDVIKTLGVQSGANYVNVYSHKEDLDRGILSEVSEFDIPKATSEKAGIITAQDKVKLDGIEEGAQVNTIESISVNGTTIDPVDKHINLLEVSRTSAAILPAASNNLGLIIPYFFSYYTPGGGVSEFPIRWGNIYFRVPNKDSWTNYCSITLIIGDNDDIYSRAPQIRLIGNPYEGISVDKENDQAIKIKTKISSDSRNILRILDDGLFVDKTLPNKQDALTEVQLNNINNAIISISINNIEQVNTNGTVNLTIPNASITENGLMSKEDKAKLDSQPTIKASDATGVTDDDYVVIKKSELNSILSRLSALENKA